MVTLVLGCHAVSVCWFNPAAGASSDQLSSGADPLGAGIFPASFYLDFFLTDSAAGGINKSRLVAITMPTTKKRNL